MDLVGPMNTISYGNKHILTVKDRGTGYLVTAPIPDRKAETVRNAFIQYWCGYFGISQVVVTGNGREFVYRSIVQTLRAQKDKSNWALIYPLLQYLSTINWLILNPDLRHRNMPLGAVLIYLDKYFLTSLMKQ